MSSAWLYYSGAMAGLSYAEVRNLPIGAVLDQIACYQIAHGAKERKIFKGSLYEQMNQILGGG